MDHQMECDQQLIQRNNFIQVNEGERTEGFIERTKSLPIVSGTTFYATLTYNTVKGKNVLVGSFMASIENIVSKAASVTIDATQKVVSFNYLDNLACKGLDKIEYNIPLIRKHWDEVVKDSREYIINKISGVSNTSETPTTVIEAFGERKQALELLLSEGLWNNKASKTVILAFNKVLDKAESIIDFIFPNQDDENCPKEVDALWPRISCLASNAKKSFISLARELNNEETGDKVTVKDVALVANHWLSQFHKSLQENPEREGMVSKVLRLSALSTVWTILAINGVVAATWPRAENYVSSIMDFIKREGTRVLTPIRSSVDKVVGPVKTAFTMSLEIVRETYEEILANVNKIFQNFPDTIRKMTSSGLDYLKNLNQYLKGIWNKGLKVTEDGSLANSATADSSTMTNGPN